MSTSTPAPTAPTPAEETASRLTPDSLTVDEPIPSRSRTFSPEVVKAVWGHLTGTPADGDTPAVPPVKNLGVGTFETEGQARSALHTLNKMLGELHGAPHIYAGTVRETDDGKYRAILLNKPAKQKAVKADEPAAAAPAAPKADADKPKAGSGQTPKASNKPANG